MTSYSNGAVRDLNKKMIDAAITRFMTEIGWFGTAEEGYTAGSWEGTIPAPTGLTGTVRIKNNSMATSSWPGEIPPGAQYVGDETRGALLYQVYELDAWVSIYEPICDRVNAAYEGWATLPLPGDFDGAIHALEEAVDAVTPASQGEGSWSFTNVDVSSSMGLMYKWISPNASGPASSLLFAFDSAYGIDRITGVMANQAQVAAALGFAVAGEKKVWENGEIDLMTILEDGWKAMDVTQGGGGSINLQVVKAFLDLAQVFTPAQIDVVLGGLSTGIDFIDTVIPKPHTDTKESTVSGGSYEEVMSSFEQALQDLEIAINNEEVEICNKLDALRGVLGDREATDFHLHPGAGIESGLVEATEMRINHDMVQTIGTRDVPIVASAFLDAADSASRETGEGVWIRENGIGWETSGPWSRWKGVLDQFDAISTGSAKELIKAGELLATAAGWIGESDAAAQEAVAGHADELERGQLEWSQP